MSAATRVIASQGLGAATATIAKEAAISNGSLFSYFATKADLLNQLYVELKVEMAAAVLDGIPTESGIREQMLYMWSHWVGWAIACPEKRRTLAHLAVSDDITHESLEAGHQAMAGMAKLLERSREVGSMRDIPLALALSIMSAMADATMDYMIQHPDDADTHCTAAFDAFWKMVV